jgi:TolA-binding protein
VLVRQGKQGEAITALEELILEYPESAVAPQARRLLDSVRGGVPKG